MAKNLRRNHYCDAKVQGALVRRFLLHWLTFVVTAFLLLVIWQVMVSGDPLKGFGQVVRDVCVRNLPVFVAMVLLLPAFIKDTIELSNRFAGPVLRLRASLSDLVDGRPVQPIKLRKGDFWCELAELFNHAINQEEGNELLSKQVRDETADEPTEVVA